MTALAKKPLCGSCVDGWLEDEDGGLVRRCPCRLELAASGQSARDQGISATVGAHPEAMRAALAIIRETAQTMPTFSSNDTRHRMRVAQVPGEVIGAAFRQAAKDKAIRRIGYLTSTDPATHAHPVVEWESLVYRGAVR